MATAKEQALIQEIQKKYGTRIDLQASPAVLLEIIRTYKHQLEDIGGKHSTIDTTIAVGIDDGVGGGGGVSGGGGVDSGGVGGDGGGGGGGGVSTIAVGINAGGRFQRVDNEALLREILTLKKQLKDVQDKLGGKGGTFRAR